MTKQEDDQERKLQWDFHLLQLLWLERKLPCLKALGTRGPLCCWGVAGDWAMRTPRRQKHKKGKGPGLGPLPLRIRQPLPTTPAPGFRSSFWVLGCMQSRLGSWSREEAESPSLWWGFKFWSSSLLGLLLFALQSPQIAALSILPRFYTLFMYMYVL